jgi:hypothetical protein
MTLPERTSCAGLHSPNPHRLTRKWGCWSNLWLFAAPHWLADNPTQANTSPASDLPSARTSSNPAASPGRALLTGLEALTASERRIAELAAQGLTNRQIAQNLFVTARTVEVISLRYSISSTSRPALRYQRHWGRPLRSRARVYDM